MEMLRPKAHWGSHFAGWIVVGLPALFSAAGIHRMDYTWVSARSMIVSALYTGVIAGALDWLIIHRAARRFHWPAIVVLFLAAPGIFAAVRPLCDSCAASYGNWHCPSSCELAKWVGPAVFLFLFVIGRLLLLRQPRQLLPVPKPAGPIYTVLYDANCPFCLHCRDWMEAQSALVRLEFVDATSTEARQHYGQLPWLGAELIVIGPSGEVWIGPAAFLICLWALREWRDFSGWLGEGGDLANSLFRFISKRRKWLSAWFAHTQCPEGHCGAALANPYR